MFDISRSGADAAASGFTRILTPEEAKQNIVPCENLAGAAENRNRKALLVIKELDFDLGSLKLLAEKKKACLLFDLSRIINSYGTRRALEMAKLRTTLKYCNKYGVFYAFATYAEDKLSQRTAEELISICGLVGLNRGQAKFALEIPKHYMVKKED
jgi:RNase P/RNase MRP subunit p30